MVVIHHGPLTAKDIFIAKLAIVQIINAYIKATIFSVKLLLKLNTNNLQRIMQNIHIAININIK